MKATKKPTRRQADFIRSFRLQPSNWMIERDTSTEMVIVNMAGKKRVLLK